MNVYPVIAKLTHAGVDWFSGERIALLKPDAEFHIGQHAISPRHDQATPLEIAEARHNALAKQKRCCF